MYILWTIMIGLLIGIVARYLMPGRDTMGFLFTTLLGIGGALIAQFLGQAAHLYLPGEPAGFIASVLGAMLILWFGRMMNRGSVV